MLPALLAAAAFALVWRPPIAAVAPPARSVFAEADVRRGAELAAIGNCQGCHTRQDGEPFAGGVPLPTPFGMLYGSNLTPDARTGIGSWSPAAFRRALREGVGRGGEHLYPAFPYEHYTRLADADIDALYAYVMTRDPVRAEPPPNELVFPLGLRPLLAGWKLLFFRPGGHPEEPPTTIAAGTSPGDAVQARGAYLIDTLGHCTGCHSPRNALGAERHGTDVAFSGGVAEGWYAPALNAASPSPVPWTVDRLERYLRTGIADEHAMAGGPMRQVTRQLAWASPADVRAIAERVVAMMGRPTPEKLAQAESSRARAAAGPLVTSEATLERGASGARIVGTARGDAAQLALGAQVYVGACSACHDLGRRVSSGSGLQLPLAVAVYDPDPATLIRIVRHGILPDDGDAARWMPAYAGALTDEQLVALLAYLRHEAAGAPPWPELARAVREAKSDP